MSVAEIISQKLLIAWPINTLFDPIDGAKFEPEIVRVYPPPFEPVSGDILLMKILY